MLESEENKEYLPIQGLEAFNKATAELLLGADNAAIKVPICMHAHPTVCSLQNAPYTPQSAPCDAGFARIILHDMTPCRVIMRK